MRSLNEAIEGNNLYVGVKEIPNTVTEYCSQNIVLLCRYL